MPPGASNRENSRSGMEREHPNGAGGGQGRDHHRESQGHGGEEYKQDHLTPHPDEMHRPASNQSKTFSMHSKGSRHGQRGPRHARKPSVPDEEFEHENPRRGPSPRGQDRSPVRKSTYRQNQKYRRESSVHKDSIDDRDRQYDRAYDDPNDYNRKNSGRGPYDNNRRSSNKGPQLHYSTPKNAYDPGVDRPMQINPSPNPNNRRLKPLDTSTPLSSAGHAVLGSVTHAGQYKRNESI